MRRGRIGLRASAGPAHRVNGGEGPRAVSAGVGLAAIRVAKTTMEEIMASLMIVKLMNGMKEYGEKRIPGERASSFIKHSRNSTMANAPS